MSDNPPNPELREPLMPIVVSLIDKQLASDEFEDALKVAGPAEIAEAQRRIRMHEGAQRAGQDQVRARMADLERRYPGVADDARANDL